MVAEVDSLCRGPSALILPWSLAEGDHTGIFRSVLPSCMKLQPFINARIGVGADTDLLGEEKNPPKTKKKSVSVII